jgi:hypothetical protein
MQSTSTSAFILAALTAGGGITGYVRTGSVPSIAAGVTVGTLVFPSFLYASFVARSHLHLVRSRWPSHSKPPAIWRRTRPSRLHSPGWIFHSSRTQVPEAIASWFEFIGFVRLVHLWQCLQTPDLEWEVMEHICCALVQSRRNLARNVQTLQFLIPFDALLFECVRFVSCRAFSLWYNGA